MDRRDLLRAAVAAPLLTAAEPAAASAAPKPAADPHRFAIAVLPDTQYLFDADSADRIRCAEVPVSDRAARRGVHLDPLDIFNPGKVIGDPDAAGQE